MPRRTAFIIDGFNVYHSLVEASKNLGLPSSRIVRVVYTFIRP